MTAGVFQSDSLPLGDGSDIAGRSNRKPFVILSDAIANIAAS